MSFINQVKNDIENVFFNSTEFAVAASYTSHDGTIDKNILIVPVNNVDLTVVEQGQVAQATITIKSADVERPKRYDTITTADTVYTVERIIQRVMGYITLSCKFDERQNPV
jgi:hypothetical protein